MANILKCKMCGGDIEVSQDMTVGKCLFCGSTMTLPRIDSDKKARLFNRANEYRLNNEFDKAYDAYKTITEEDEQEAEAYWGMLLSEYGVEYVEDPNSGKRIPTCHRTQIQSILDNTNYKYALQYSTGESKFIYQDEAEILDKVQRKIISISSQIEPYDVFICYKESEDETGERTRDSILAESIYNEYEKQGVRTFFARISLEEHLGENYEPYIYAALKSARIMVVVSTTSEHVEAVWVKNEWSRFLHFMEEDDSKVLIPVYQDMNAYDFPKSLSGFQMQDMSKVGAIQDLVRGTKKILGTTRTETRDAQLQALIADKQERERKNRKIRKLIPLIVGIAVVFIAAITGLLLFKIKSLEEKPVENNNTTITASRDIIQTQEGYELFFDYQFIMEDQTCLEFSYQDDRTCYVQKEKYTWDYVDDGDGVSGLFIYDGSSLKYTFRLSRYTTSDNYPMILATLMENEGSFNGRCYIDIFLEELNDSQKKEIAEIGKKSIVIDENDEIPSSSEYSKFVVPINSDNFDNYCRLFTDKDRNATYNTVLLNNIYSEGWHWGGVVNNYEGNQKCKLYGVTNRLLPFCMDDGVIKQRINTGLIKDGMEKMESTVMAVFYSEDAIESEEYSEYGSKTIRLKNGERIALGRKGENGTVVYKGRRY